MNPPDLPPTTFAINECEEAFVRDFCPYRGSPDPLVVWHAAWAAAVLAERERCAKLLERTGNDHCAAAIRAEPPKEQQP